MAKRPKCGRDNRKPVIGWVGGARTGKPMNVQRFGCSSCGTGQVARMDSKTGQVKKTSRKA